MRLGTYFCACGVIGLVASYLAGFVSPEYWPGLGLVALSYPFWVVWNWIQWIVLLVRREKRLLLITTAFILLTGGSLLSTVQVSFRSKEGFHLVSANVRVFNKYKYLRGEGYEKCKRSMNEIIDLNADVYCLQEYFELPGDSVFAFSQLLPSGYSNSISVAHKDRLGGLFGLGIFSKYPIIADGDLVFEGTGNRAQWADLVLESDTLRVYNLHLQSVYVRDRELVETIGEVNVSRRDSVEFLEKMLAAFEKRAFQTDVVLKHSLKCPFPVILAGDFNDTPYSYTYHLFNWHWKNAFEDEGMGLGLSTHKTDYPGVRIDNHFFDDENLQCNSFEVRKECVESDHYPVSGYYSFR